MERDDYDSPWKEGLVKYLPRFFEFFFPEIFRDVDWQRPPHFLDTKLQAVAPRRITNKRAGPRVVDALVELQQLSGQPTLVLVHIEIQAQKVKEFEKRMLLYHTRILERYGKPVCSLVILADKNSSWRPGRTVERPGFGPLQANRLGPKAVPETRGRFLAKITRDGKGVKDAVYHEC